MIKLDEMPEGYKYCAFCKGEGEYKLNSVTIEICPYCEATGIVPDFTEKPSINDEARERSIKVNQALELIKNEFYEAKIGHPEKYVNQHEAYAVILEELDELWVEIKKKQVNYDLPAQRKEAAQTAAMLLRLIVELL